jgi:type IV pilus assembly protein PilC
MISAGLPIVRALTILSKQTTNVAMRDVVEDVIKRLEEGEPLSSAFSHHPRVFNEVYIASLKAAEASGKFEQVLEQLADQQEKDYKLNSSIKSAMAYPLFIVAAMIVAGAVLLMMVIPKLEEVFKDSNMALPWTTQALIATANFLLTSWYIIIIIIVALILWARYYARTDNGRFVVGKILISAPLLKDFYINVYMAKFSVTFSMLVSSGVPIIQAIKLVGSVMGNAVYEKYMKKVSGQLERGVPMSVPLAEASEFPPIVSQMIAVGEQTGKVDEILLTLARLFQDETDKKVKSLTSLLEPILLIIVGLGVGTIVFSIIIPIYQISGNLS